MDLVKSLKKEFNLPRIISHSAFGFLVLFIGLNHNFSTENDFNIRLGETQKFDNFKINFANLSMKEHENYKAVIGEFKIDDLKKKYSHTLKPEIRIYENPSTLTYEASIRSRLLEDYYITMSNIDRSEFYNIKFQKKPFMLWIWISVIFISLGGFLRLFKNENKNY
tara:strand:- start:13 stop:510 length:498 start_codon:yes stop_codon:yes gene_type:complete